MAATTPPAYNNGTEDDNDKLDSEYTPIYEDEYVNETTAEETEGFKDVFREIPVKQESGSMASTAWIETSVKFLKLMAYIVMFSLVLGAAVVVKGTLLLITSQLRKGRQINHCNRALALDKQFITYLSLDERVTWFWAALIVYAAPELGMFLSSARKCFFKTAMKVRPTKLQFLIAFAVETLQAAGVGILVLIILPELDVVKGAMLMNAVCIVPGICTWITRDFTDSRYHIKILLDALAISAQATAFIVWPLLDGRKRLWLIPFACIFISVGWWENYVNINKNQTATLLFLLKIRNGLKETRYYTMRILSIWKILVFGACAMISLYLQNDDPFSLFSHLPTALSERNYTVYEVQVEKQDAYDDGLLSFNVTGDTFLRPVYLSSPLWVALVSVSTAYLCFACAKLACKILIQNFSFSFALSMVGPVTIHLLIIICDIKKDNHCAFKPIPDYLFFDTPPVYFIWKYVGCEIAWAWLLWLVSQVWITCHIWYPRCNRLAPTDKLFAKPWYCGPLIDQCLVLNRTKDDEPNISLEDIKGLANDTPITSSDRKGVESTDSITRINICATMWHETKDEMVKFLKSIFRLDEDQCARRLAQKYRNAIDVDYYEMEAHIFMDDAFSSEDSRVNSFVKCLVETIDEAASEVHLTNVKLRPPIKIPTPYGGRLQWTMPGKNKLICHLKDKTKIRNKKRWSQVMYMYYFLKHRLIDLPIALDRKATIAKNTHMLTLDGDVDFKPQAVTLLLDLMKKDKLLGTACGRIHPVGSGFIAWYQTFEYAIGHWLQKATEHMIGCVLCSPGCFSLFRAEALMDDNVIKKYTLTSHKARHYVQYDQGEDRWLCTLLLQRGYRVEYSAASNAYTHCPERFDEFYNQRRRWVPSTMANILDLLKDAKHTVRVNDNISTLYIVYQIFLTIGTVLGPGTIFLMLVGAMNSITGMSIMNSLIFNLLPVAAFIFVCMTCKSDVQILLANIITCLYAMLMMMVIVSVVLQILEDGWLAPSCVFTVITFGSFFLTALMHPQEIDCLLYLVIYYITIPSMYMLLIIYSLCNLNNVSWGTREVAQEKSAKELEKEKTDPDEVQKKEEAQVPIKWCGGDKLELNTLRRRRFGHSSMDLRADTLPIPSEYTLSEHSTDVPSEERDDRKNPLWIEDPNLQNGKVLFLKKTEVKFWEGLIAEYLQPIDDNKEEQKRIKTDLDNLRDTVVFAFVMLNALFVLVIFLLQLKQDKLYLRWPFGQEVTISYDIAMNFVTINQNYLKLEPIGSLLLVFFGSVMIIQFTAMMFHRMGTLTHLLSTAQVTKRSSQHEIEIAKVLQRLNDIDLQKRDLDSDLLSRRKIVHNLMKPRDTEHNIADLEASFLKRHPMTEQQQQTDPSIKIQI